MRERVLEREQLVPRPVDVPGCRVRPHSRPAALARAPDAGWVAFATALSGEIARRNR